jgi:hypothetical protein
MRILLVLCLAAAFALSAAAVWADLDSAPGAADGEDGIINYDPGTAGSTSTSFYGQYTDWSPDHNACETFAEKYGDGFTWSGIYDYDDYRWICEECVGEVEHLDVICDIEMYAWETLDASGAYFHIADATTTYMEVILNGEFCSNNGMYLGVTIPGQEEKQEPPSPPTLVFIEDGFGRTAQYYIDNGRPVPPDIPLSLMFQYYNPDQGSWGYWDGATWVADGWDPGFWSWGNNNQDLAWWWNPIKEVCCHNFRIKVDITPEYHQPDGRYMVDPAFVSAPIL